MEKIDLLLYPLGGFVAYIAIAWLLDKIGGRR